MSRCRGQIPPDFAPTFGAHAPHDGALRVRTKKSADGVEITNGFDAGSVADRDLSHRHAARLQRPRNCTDLAEVAVSHVGIRFSDKEKSQLAS